MARVCAICQDGFISTSTSSNGLDELKLPLLEWDANNVSILQFVKLEGGSRVPVPLPKGRKRFLSIGSSLGPHWSEVNVQSMRDVLFAKELLFKILQKDFDESTLQSIDIEGRRKQGKMDLQDCKDLHVCSLLEVERSKKSLFDLKDARENLVHKLTSCENRMVTSLFMSDSSKLGIQELK